MKINKHHIIPKSRGGTDDDWNLVERDVYTHAYEHALDFVLFKQAPWFDCRLESWPFLPSELREAVLKEYSRRTSERNLQWAASGSHPMQQEHNRIAASERSSRWCEKRLKEGTHPFMGPKASEKRSEENRSRVLKGIHNLQGAENAQRSSRLQLKRVEEGVHQWKTKEHSKSVSERFKGAKHWVNEKGERKFQREKPEGDWQNRRKWKDQ